MPQFRVTRLIKHVLQQFCPERAIFITCPRSQVTAPASIRSHCYQCPRVELKPKRKAGSTPKVKRIFPTTHSPLVSHKVALERDGLRHIISADRLVRSPDENVRGQLTAYNRDIGGQMHAHHAQHASILEFASTV